MLKIKKAQSILEYVLVLSAVVLAILAGAAALTNRSTNSPMGNLMNSTAQRIENATGLIAQ